jgi:hypothetical protein
MARRFLISITLGLLAAACAGQQSDRTAQEPHTPQSASARPASATDAGATAALSDGSSGRILRLSDSLACTEKGDSDGARCEAKPGCTWQPELRCQGIPPSPEQQQQWRDADQSGSRPCVCVCQQDELLCRMVP